MIDYSDDELVKFETAKNLKVLGMIKNAYMYMRIQKMVNIPNHINMEV